MQFKKRRWIKLSSVALISLPMTAIAVACGGSQAPVDPNAPNDSERVRTAFNALPQTIVLKDGFSKPAAQFAAQFTGNESLNLLNSDLATPIAANEGVTYNLRAMATGNDITLIISVSINDSKQEKTYNFTLPEQEGNLTALDRALSFVANSENIAASNFDIKLRSGVKVADLSQKTFLDSFMSGDFIITPTQAAADKAKAVNMSYVFRSFKNGEPDGNVDILPFLNTDGILSSTKATIQLWAVPLDTNQTTLIPSGRTPFVIDLDALISGSNSASSEVENTSDPQPEGALTKSSTITFKETTNDEAHLINRFLVNGFLSRPRVELSKNFSAKLANGVDAATIKTYSVDQAFAKNAIEVTPSADFAKRASDARVNVIFRKFDPQAADNNLDLLETNVSGNEAQARAQIWIRGGLMQTSAPDASFKRAITSLSLNSILGAGNGLTFATRKSKLDAAIQEGVTSTNFFLELNNGVTIADLSSKTILEAFQAGDVSIKSRTADTDVAIKGVDFVFRTFNANQPDFNNDLFPKKTPGTDGNETLDHTQATVQLWAVAGRASLGQIRQAFPVFDLSELQLKSGDTFTTVAPVFKDITTPVMQKEAIEQAKLFISNLGLGQERADKFSFEVDSSVNSNKTIFQAFKDGNIAFPPTNTKNVAIINEAKKYGVTRLALRAFDAKVPDGQLDLIPSQADPSKAYVQLWAIVDGPIANDVPLARIPFLVELNLTKNDQDVQNNVTFATKATVNALRSDKEKLQNTHYVIGNKNDVKGLIDLLRSEISSSSKESANILSLLSNTNASIFTLPNFPTPVTSENVSLVFGEDQTTPESKLTIVTEGELSPRFYLHAYLRVTTASGIYQEKVRIGFHTISISHVNQAQTLTPDQIARQRAIDFINGSFVPDSANPSTTVSNIDKSLFNVTFKTGVTAQTLATKTLLQAFESGDIIITPIAAAADNASTHNVKYVFRPFNKLQPDSNLDLLPTYDNTGKLTTTKAAVQLWVVPQTEGANPGNIRGGRVPFVIDLDDLNLPSGTAAITFQESSAIATKNLNNILVQGFLSRPNVKEAMNFRPSTINNGQTVENFSSQNVDSVFAKGDITITATEELLKRAKDARVRIVFRKFDANASDRNLDLIETTTKDGVTSADAQIWVVSTLGVESAAAKQAFRLPLNDIFPRKTFRFTPARTTVSNFASNNDNFKASDFTLTVRDGVDLSTKTIQEAFEAGDIMIVPNSDLQQTIAKNGIEFVFRMFNPDINASPDFNIDLFPDRNEDKTLDFSRVVVQMWVVSGRGTDNQTRQAFTKRIPFGDFKQAVNPEVSTTFKVPTNSMQDAERSARQFIGSIGSIEQRAQAFKFTVNNVDDKGVSGKTVFQAFVDGDVAIDKTNSQEIIDRAKKYNIDIRLRTFDVTAPDGKLDLIPSADDPTKVYVQLWAAVLSSNGSNAVITSVPFLVPLNMTTIGSSTDMRNVTFKAEPSVTTLRADKANLNKPFTTLNIKSELMMLFNGLQTLPTTTTTIMGVLNLITESNIILKPELPSPIPSNLTFGGNTLQDSIQVTPINEASGSLNGQAVIKLKLSVDVPVQIPGANGAAPTNHTFNYSETFNLYLNGDTTDTI